MNTTETGIHSAPLIMMKTDIKDILKVLPLILITLAASMTFTACNSDGPVEEATEEMGDTAEDVGESVDNAFGN